MNNQLNSLPPKVLVIEDSRVAVKVLRTDLMNHGFEVDSANDLKTGLEQVTQGGIAVVLLDLSLPDSMGLDTFTRVQTVAPDVPIVVLTGLDDDKVGLEAISRGAQDYLIKGRPRDESLGRCLHYAIGRKQLEQKIKQLNEELEQRVLERTLELARSNAELQQFSKVAAHDLQEPLRVVQGYVELLSRRYKGKLDKEADEFMEYIMDGTNRMTQLIQDVLKHSSIKMHDKQLEATDSAAALDAALYNLKVSIDESGAQITRGHLPRVIADKLELLQLFQNLIGNAIKYRGAQPPVIQVSATRADGDWLFAIEDNGIGIEARFHARVFEMFKRLHGKQTYSGTGIGLAICKKIIESHQGRIWIESEPDKGSKVFFTLRGAERAEKRLVTSSLFWRNNQ